MTRWAARRSPPLSQKRGMPDWEGREVPEHPGTEMLSAYVDGTLDDHERAAVAAHVASCEECLELVSEVLHALPEEVVAGGVAPGAVAETPRHEGPPRVLPFTRRRWVWAAAGVVAAAAALVVSVRLTPWLANQSEEQLISQLVEAAPDARPSSARLTGGFSYRRPLSPLRSALPARARNLRLESAVRTLEETITPSSSAAELHATGLGHLLLARPDAAKSFLAKAVELTPTAAYLSDLSAACIASFEATGRPSLAEEALALTDRALAEDPGHVEALFNRAVALQRLRRDSLAIDAWRRYVEVDSGSPWADEASERINELRKANP